MAARSLAASDRRRLEVSVLAARRAAEGASRAALGGLGVFDDRRPDHLDAARAALRNGLRAKWRQLGGEAEMLVAECAYEQWHRLLFARFLAENKMLLHPKFKTPVTLADCEDLAAEVGEPDAWSVAARFASEILPGIFRLDDPCVRLRLAPEGRHALEQILDAIPAETFVADDALGWVYQFWQKDKKDEVNASERKIGGADLGPVTQLFTENYMVRFLLENSLGAWWAGRHPDSPLVKAFEYLRMDDEGRPAAGSFDGWPERIAEVTVMDPCCGSGHFLVEAFSMLWQMRAAEERLSPVEAQDAVLRDNLFGLELDPRCVQIAMFAVALQAWKAGGGWRRLPVPNIACSGIPVKAPVEEWQALSGGDANLENALARLHAAFRHADTLGSLIDPQRTTEMLDSAGRQTSLLDVDWAKVAPALQHATGREDDDPAVSVLGGDAAAVSRAALHLARAYTLITTNVPYLKSASHSQELRDFLNERLPLSAGDLGTAMFARFQSNSSTLACVLPQGWLGLRTFIGFRREVLSLRRLNVLVALGPGAFGSISGEVVQPILLVSASGRPTAEAAFVAIDARHDNGVMAKAAHLRDGDYRSLVQADQRGNPDMRITLVPPAPGRLLAEFADCAKGLSLGDGPRYARNFWEVPDTSPPWLFLQSTGEDEAAFGGRSQILLWENGQGALSLESSARIQGLRAWGKPGVLISLMNLRSTLYSGHAFDQNCAVVRTHDADLMPALWAFCRSPEFADAVRVLDQNIKVTNATLLKVSFDVERWRKVAEDAGLLPVPWSDDPTQWLFDGRPEVSTAPLQVAVARLVGYRWPEQPESDDLDVLADADGIVCLPSVAGEAPGSNRVLQLLAVAYGDSWTPERANELLGRVGSRKRNVEEWLRDEFFMQHCALFGNRPFVWHVWDGLRDGFSALVNYHRLDRRTLEKLTYTYLGQDWVERQRAAVRDVVPGAEGRLAAALQLQRKLELIIEGEDPFDIFVRWKGLHEQPVGWEPDVNDGVRLNVRPFVQAGVLRAPFNIQWNKDRGKNPNGSERENDKHRTLVSKLDARESRRRP